MNSRAHSGSMQGSRHMAGERSGLRGLAAAWVALVALALLIQGCASTAPAPVSDRTAKPAPQTKPPVPQATPVPGAPAVAVVPEGTPAGFHRVKRGETLYGIALENGQDHRDIARWNTIEDPNRIREGQLLRVTPPAGESVQVGAARGSGSVSSRPLDSRSEPAPAAQPQTAEGATKSAPKALRLPYSQDNLALLQRGDAAAASAAKPPAQKEPAKPEAVAKPEPAKPAAEPAARAAVDPDAPEFVWPARGKVIGTFNDSTNKGIDIAGKPGDPVVAAAPGRVIYIGTGIRGYGQLIVIKHDANYNSVYAHNRAILVKQDQTVARGQKIAELGDTDADTPKLHFEIRRSGKPVDPAKYLPAP